MLQYKIPQNVGIQDKIVGPLTLRQLITLAIGAGISWIFFGILSKLYELNIFEYIIIALPILIATAMSLIKINDITLSKFVLLFIEFGIKPKKRVWDHRGIAALVAPDLSERGKKEFKKNTLEAVNEKKPQNLRELSRILDSGGFNNIQTLTCDDLDTVNDEDLMSQAFFGHKKNKTQNMYWRANKHDKGKRLNLLAKLPTTQIKKAEVITKAIEVAPKTVDKKEKTEDGTKIEIPKKKQRKRRKKKAVPNAHNKTQINNTKKKKPAEFIPLKIMKRVSGDTKKPFQKKAQNNQGEFKIKELQQGEIEINLD
jgi:hypothetical protein